MFSRKMVTNVLEQGFVLQKRESSLDIFSVRKADEEEKQKTWLFFPSCAFLCILQWDFSHSSFLPSWPLVSCSIHSIHVPSISFPCSSHVPSIFLPYFLSCFHPYFLLSFLPKLTLLLFQIFVPDIPPALLYRCLNRRPKELSLYAYEQC